MRRGLGRAVAVAVVTSGLTVGAPLAAQACGCGGFVADQQVRVHCPEI